MEAESILDEFAGQGWNDESKLALLLRYIDNQGAGDAFRDFLQEAANDENEESAE